MTPPHWTFQVTPILSGMPLVSHLWKHTISHSRYRTRDHVAGMEQALFSCSVDGCEHCKDSSQIDFCQWELICWETKIPRLWVVMALVCLPKIGIEKFYLDISMTFRNVLMMLKSANVVPLLKSPICLPKSHWYGLRQTVPNHLSREAMLISSPL